MKEHYKEKSTITLSLDLEEILKTALILNVLFFLNLVLIYIIG